ncbi:MAG: prolyl oligopeptidase family serine peptidase [Planctomycetia bacterium]|nr:prolyl oligopeptidase family serine peptidase [Planctomycetia bacterium]
MRHILLLFILPLVTITSYGSLQDKQADNFRRLPPAGIKISDADRAELTKDVAALEQEIKDARKELQGQPRLLDLFPDVMIFHKAVDWALKYDEFYEAREVNAARELLKAGRERLAQIKSRKPEYISECGLVVRGYLSKIDSSVQPYGLAIPESYTPKTLSKYRLDVWLHGRGEKLTELAFIDQRSRQPGEFTPQDAFVLHPYGRYCNAFKFAGEVDVFEALEHCKKHYRIDEKRLVVRGFSMGGAGCWHLAVHHPDKWCTAAPGAGFAETAEFANIANDPVPPTWWEKKLWNWYDATSYAENLKNLPTVAYSGEIDKQKQAADVMAREMKKFGMTLRHIIGPKTGHSYHPEAKREVNRSIARAIEFERLKGLDDGIESIFTTWTLRYASCGALMIDQLDEHWKRARIEFERRGGVGGQGLNASTGFKTTNVSAFSIKTQFGGMFSDELGIDEDTVVLPKTQSDGALIAHFRKDNGKWKLVDTLDDGKLRKKPGLQGPIDDAFMDSFLIVKPSDKSPYAKVNEWVDAEMNRAIDQWRKHFRGIPRVKMDKEVTEADINNHNLILWGLPDSNSVLKKIVGKLPIRWVDGKLHADDNSYDADTHAPILIYPNPLNPSKYIVLNSGHTFREESNRSNARQTPKLPDWAIVDITTPPNSYHPGKVVDAGFFGEQWEWKKQESR